MAGKTKKALPFKRGNTFFADPTDIFIPGVDDQDDHFLKDLDVGRHKIHEATVLNIMKNGVIQAVTVTKEGDGRVVVVAGRRRLMHAREANKRLVAEGKKAIEVEVKPKRGSESELFGIFISENEHRVGDEPLGRARKAERARSMGATDPEIAIDFGVTPRTLNNWNRLLELDDRLLKMVEQGKLTANAALVFHGLAPDEQVAQAKAALAEAASTGRRPTERNIEESIKPDKPRAPSVKLVAKMVERRPKGISKEFLRGLQLGRGMISAEEAGVAEILEEVKKTKPKDKAVKKGNGKKASAKTGNGKKASAKKGNGKKASAKKGGSKKAAKKPPIHTSPAKAPAKKRGASQGASS